MSLRAGFFFSRVLRKEFMERFSVYEIHKVMLEMFSRVKMFVNRAGLVLSLQLPLTLSSFHIRMNSVFLSGYNGFVFILPFKQSIK